MNKDDLKARTKRFALAVIKIVDTLPNTTTGRAIGGQLVRSGTSVGSNYRSACRGKSRADFIAKLGIVEEEADESAYWLELILEARLLKEPDVFTLLKEANELTSIITASRITAKKNS
jgi:four helix bundle protein